MVPSLTCIPPRALVHCAAPSFVIRSGLRWARLFRNIPKCLIWSWGFPGFRVLPVKALVLLSECRSDQSPWADWIHCPAGPDMMWDLWASSLPSRLLCGVVTWKKESHSPSCTAYPLVRPQWAFEAHLSIALQEFLRMRRTEGGKEQGRKKGWMEGHAEGGQRPCSFVHLDSGASSPHILLRQNSEMFLGPGKRGPMRNQGTLLDGNI